MSSTLTAGVKTVIEYYTGIRGVEVLPDTSLSTGRVENPGKNDCEILRQPVCQVNQLSTE